jgi:hypothetical protein
MRKAIFIKSVILLLTLLTGAHAQEDYNKNEGYLVSKAETEITAEYWTEDKIQEAAPLPSPELTENEINRLLENFGLLEKGHGISSSDEKQLGNPSNADVASPPYDKSGKLFFTDPKSGDNYTCSAQFVGNVNVLMTAAHCVRDRDGEWHKNILFKRAFPETSGQEVGAICLSTKRGWVIGGINRWKWDYAFIRTSSSSDSGFMHIMTEIPISQLQAIGYPLNYGNSMRMQKVYGIKGDVSTGIVEMKGNPMRKGSSGGAWLDNNNNAVGLNSFHKKGNTTDEWGPYFDHDTMTLYDFALRGCRE